mmetsp:Transcript_20910/g.41843  ORF Transcript_20910/g.41843 Transcript_20910/m.41843 type:complete len:201 (+) Transcript_20910:1107-1709(+)
MAFSTSWKLMPSPSVSSVRRGRETVWYRPPSERMSLRRMARASASPYRPTPALTGATTSSFFSSSVSWAAAFSASSAFPASRTVAMCARHSRTSARGSSASSIWRCSSARWGGTARSSPRAWSSASSAARVGFVLNPSSVAIRAVFSCAISSSVVVSGLALFSASPAPSAGMHRAASSTQDAWRVRSASVMWRAYSRQRV